MASPIYRLCDRYVEEMAALDPVSATSRGILGHDADMTDYSPAGWAARDELDRRVASELARQEPADWRDRVAQGLLAGQLSTAQAFHDAGEDLRALRVIASPFQEVRQVFDIMPSETEDQWSTIAARLEKVPTALAGLRSSLREAVSRRLPPPRRQVLACAAQGEAWAGQRGERPFFVGLAGRYAGHDPALARRLEQAASAATEAYASMASWMRGELAAQGPERDAAGRERYSLFARRALGSTPDLVDTYAWGWEELHRLEDEMARVARLVAPGASVAEAIELLETDPGRAAQGPEALRSYLQDLIDRTVEQLDGVHFDIPAVLKRVEAMIAPPGGAAAMYYTGPSEDFSRPGRTWYPTLGKTVFPLWGEVSICYHEAVPGHHLQVGQARYLKEELSRFQRTTFVSGHGEGWALYAERLMDELGYFEGPEFRLGFLREQVMRAVRVVVDIGMHLELPIPAGERFHPGETWTPALGREFVEERSCFPRDFVASELDRYLGWPAQAICYKVGERAWLEARAEARRRLGSAFNLKQWHAHALGVGPLLLDQFPAELTGGWGTSGVGLGGTASISGLGPGPGETAPGHRSETPVRDAGPRRRSETPVRDASPRRQSETPVRDASPRRQSETPVRDAGPKTDRREVVSRTSIGFWYKTGLFSDRCGFPWSTSASFWAGLTGASLYVWRPRRWAPSTLGALYRPPSIRRLRWSVPGPP